MIGVWESKLDEEDKKAKKEVNKSNLRRMKREAGYTYIFCHIVMINFRIIPGRLLPLPSFSWKHQTPNWFCCVNKVKYNVFQNYFSISSYPDNER